LLAQFSSAIKENRPPGGDADLVFGGGSYEHGVLKRGVSVDTPEGTVEQPISAPGDIDEQFLVGIYGQRMIADKPLWDPDQYWYGTALSAFGLVYNRDVLRRLDLPEPRTWDAMIDPRLRTWIALVNPNQSGSITTAFETILQRRGWAPGWQILRRASANARDFSASSLKAPTDVSHGDAAVGVCIDFFGRYQSQAIEDHGGGDRIGYVDPKGDTMVDPDPISLLHNAPDPELAQRFIRFVLEVPGQSLWQFQPEAGASDVLGPREFALRRLPVNRRLYTDYAERMIDDIDPYREAQMPEHPDRAMRAFIAPMFGAMAMDNHDLLVAAWTAIVEHPAYPATTGLVTADMVDDPVLREMLTAFDAMPDVAGPDGGRIGLDTAEARGVVKAGWLRGGWESKGLWPHDAEPERVLRQAFRDFFAGQYQRVVELAGGGQAGDR
ncbi:MAG: extracellular solute-binding protein, partial [Planctomycetota bacterium]|nr:extracellular solute-binding protein [Planctomycetota bacterium]